MRNIFLQFLICTLIAVSAQTARADDLNKFDPESAEMNLLKEEESFLNDLLDSNNEVDSKEKNNAVITKDNIESSKEKVDKNLGNIVNVKKEMPQKNDVESVSKSTPLAAPSCDFSSKDKEIKRISSENATLKRKLSDSQNKVKSLQAQLAEMRDSLILAETEVERLGKITKSDYRNTSTSNPSYKPSIGNSMYSNRKPARAIPIQKDPLLSKQQEQKANDEMPIATVVVDKANLRAGPGTNNSPIMTIGKGTRLAIETRQGDWYRVVAPTGERAWISRDTIAFGRDPRSSPSRTVKVQSVNRNEEEMAIELIRKR